MAAPYDKDAYKPLDTFAFEQITVAGTSIGFTAATHAGPTTGGPAILATVNVEGAQVRYRLDATNPSATVGALFNDGDELLVWATMDIDSIQFIRTGGVSATLNVHYAR